MKIERLKEIRIDRDYLQKDIADYLKITQQAYSRYELGFIKMPIELYSKLADLYNTSIDYIVGRTDERKPYKKSSL